MNRIVIGKVLKPQGIRGEVKVLPITYDVQRFEDLESVYLEDDLLEIEKCAIREGYVYLSFEGYGNRNDVEGLRDKFLYVDESEAIELPDDCYFIKDLVDCVVYLDDETKVGVISEVLQNGSADVYVIDKGKIMFPALKELLLSVDTENKRIVLNSKRYSEVCVYAD